MAYQVMTGRFVGRTEELARLRELLTRSANGEPLVALIGGEAGIGKTRLVDQLTVTANEQGVRVLRGGCVPLGGEGLPLAPVTQALRALAHDLDPVELEAIAGPARAHLAPLIPALAGNAHAAAGADVAAAGQGRLLELLLGVVERLAGSAPLLWVMEDLHWADRSTRDLVAHLTTYLRTGRMLLVLTFRRDELHRLHPLHGLLAELARNRRVQRLELPRFSRAELAEQLAGLLAADPPAGLVEDIYARSEGNPFFTEELVLAGAGPGALPPSLQDVLLTRVVRLGHDTQQVLRVAAVAGPGVTQPVLAVVTGKDEAELLDSLREAVDQQVLLAEPGGDGYVFRHALVAEAIYGELLPGERARVHTALASALEAGAGSRIPWATRAALIAHHWSAAGDQPRALRASVEAAAAAEQVYAFAEAELQLERALELWDRVPDAEERAGVDRPMVLSRCAEAAYAAGDTARAAQLVRQAMPLVDEALQPQWLGLLHEQLARCLRMLGDPGALGAQQEAVRLVASEPSPERARVLSSLALLLGLVGRFEEAREVAEEAVAIACRSAPAPRRPTPAARWAAPSSSSAKPTLGLPSGRLRSASPRRQVTRSACCGRSSITPPDCWRPAVCRRRWRPLLAASIRLAVLVWSAPTGCRTWLAPPPRRCSPSAAGIRPRRSPEKTSRPPHRMRPRSLCRSLGLPSSRGPGPGRRRPQQ